MLRRFDRIEHRIRRHAEFLRIPRPRLRDRMNPLEFYDGLQFKLRFHLFKETVVFLDCLISSQLSSPVRRGVVIPPMTQLCIALRFYATGNFQLHNGDHASVCQATVCNILRRVSIELAKLSKKFIVYPSAEEAKDIRLQFKEYSKFPGVVGAIDGCLIKIKSPGGDEAELFRCRKQYFAINIQAICDLNLICRNLVVRWYGSAHDSRIFLNSTISDGLEDGSLPGILVGDSGYPQTRYLMTPISKPTTLPQQRYNKSQIRARNCIERFFGVIKRRFPCLLHLRLKLSTSMSVIVALGVIHNICRSRRDIYEEDRYDKDINPDPATPCCSTPTVSGTAARNNIITSHFSN